MATFVSRDAGGEVDNEFADVVRIPQDDGPDPICPINYDTDFVACMDLFRGVMQTGELSPRVLKVCVM